MGQVVLVAQVVHACDAGAKQLAVAADVVHRRVREVDAVIAELAPDHANAG